MAKLPDLNFFEPTPEFIAWMRETPWLRFKRIVDCGAGRGLVGKLLTAAGADVLSIDLHERETTESPVEIADATTFNFDSSDDVCLICRPCHSGWSEATYTRAFKFGVLDALYVGLERNIAEDFGDDWVTEKVFENAGAEGEHVWRVIGRKADCKSFARTGEANWGKVQTGTNPRTGEAELRLVNSAGGYMPIAPADIKETLSRLEIDQIHNDPSVYAASSAQASEGAQAEGRGFGDKGQYGWVGPSGEWYPCGSMHHESMLRWSFAITDRRARSIGFIKAYGTFFSKLNDKGVTPAQEKTLLSIGYKVSDYEREEDRSVESLSKTEQTAFRAATFKTRRQLDGD